MGAEPGASNLQTDLALAYARHGDTLAGVRLDRLGRSLGKLLPAQAVISLTLSVKRTDTGGECSGYAARAAKRDVRVGAMGRPANHAAMRSRLMAAAVAACCRVVLARPR